MYGKIFSSIFDSTLCADGGWLPTYVFMSLVTLADKDGKVEIAPRALYRRLGFDVAKKVGFDEFENALQYLQSPDEHSNTTDFEGRRIIPLSEFDDSLGNRGFYVVNYEKYKIKASKTEPAGSSTERVRRFRERQKNQTQGQNETVKETVETENETDRNEHIDIDIDLDIKNPLSTDKLLTPHKAIIALWHEILPELQGIKVWNTTRKTLLKARWSEEPERQNLDWWKKFFEYIRTCPHLMGKNDRSWQATLPWILKADNFAKVIEGNYEKKG